MVTSPQTKRADIGGAAGDDFELAFANMAHAYIREKAPSLAPFELGFQLVERNDEGDRAMGVTAFQVGPQLIYAPMFWLKGKIKGHESFYLPKEGVFLPLKENWLNTILQRRAPQIGANVDKQPRQLGVRQPDLMRLTRSINKVAMTPAALADADPLLDCLRVATPAMLRDFQQTLVSWPKLAQAADTFYGQALLDAIAAGVRSNVAAPQLKCAGSGLSLSPGAYMAVRITSYQRGVVPSDLTDAAREKLLRDGLLIQDERPDSGVATLYDTESYPTTFNPRVSGIYRVLTKTGKAERCLVIVSPISTAGPVGHTVVVRLADGAYIAAPMGKVFATSTEPEGLHKEIKEWPSVSDLPGRYESDYVVVTAVGHGTVKLSTRQTIDSLGSRRAYNVYCSDTGDDVLGVYKGTDDDPCEGQLHIDRNDGVRLRWLDGHIHVPPDAKYVRVCRACGHDDDPFELGDMHCASRAALAGMTKISMFYDGGEHIVQLGDNEKFRGSAGAALIHLVKTAGFREATARDLIKRATAQRVVRTWFKQAADPYLTSEQSPTPFLPLQAEMGSASLRDGTVIPTQYSTQRRAPAFLTQEPMPVPQDVHHTDPQGALYAAQQAAQSGQKELFSVAMLRNLLRTMSDEQLVERFIPALSKARNALGHLLFLFHWHQDDFEDRYGSDELPDLEDALRNEFEGIGDLELKLRQKTVEPFPEEQRLGVDLQNAAEG